MSVATDTAITTVRCQHCATSAPSTRTMCPQCRRRMRPSATSKPGGAPRPAVRPTPPDPRLIRDLAADTAELTALVAAAASHLEGVVLPTHRPLIPSAISERLAEHRVQIVLATAIGVVFAYGVWIGAISPSALNASVLFLWIVLVLLYVVGRLVWERLDHL